MHYSDCVPVLLLFAVLLVALLAAVVLFPLGLIQRYRAGTTRRRARRWVAGLNVMGLSFSVVLFLGGAMITNRWAPGALNYSLGGLGIGGLLGLVGLAMTRWEGGSGELHYTPNRFLVLTITLLVAARLAYGIWRLWHAWNVRGDEQWWLENSGISGSLGASAVVLGYTLVYWIGMMRKIQETGSALKSA